MTTLYENFNGYNDGDLHGQGGWAGDATFDVQGAVVQEGAKAVSAVPDGVNRHIYKDFPSGQATASQIFYMRAAQTDKRGGVIIRDQADNIIFIVNLHENGQITFYNDPTTGLDYYNVQAYVADTWYKIEIEWQVSDHKARARVNDGTWTGWGVGVNDTWTTLDSIGPWTHDGSTGGTLYWDSFFYTLEINVHDCADLKEKIGG